MLIKLYIEYMDIGLKVKIHSNGALSRDSATFIRNKNIQEGVKKASARVTNIRKTTVRGEGARGSKEIVNNT